MNKFVSVLGLLVLLFVSGCATTPSTHSKWENSGETTEMKKATTNGTLVVRTYANRGYQDGPGASVSQQQPVVEEEAPVTQGYWSTPRVVPASANAAPCLDGMIDASWRYTGP